MATPPPPPLPHPAPAPRKDIHVLIFGTCACYLLWQRKEFEDVINLKISQWEYYLGFSRWALNAIICILIRGGFDTDTRKRKPCKGSREESGKEDAKSLVLKAEDTSWAKECRSRSKKKKGNRFFLRASGGRVVLETPWFGSNKTDFELLASRTVREQILVVSNLRLLQ